MSNAVDSAFIRISSFWTSFDIWISTFVIPIVASKPLPPAEGFSEHFFIRVFEDAAGGDTAG